jgi:hypothetical protein
MALKSSKFFCMFLQGPHHELSMKERLQSGSVVSLRSNCGKDASDNSKKHFVNKVEKWIPCEKNNCKPFGF